jgi:hypothetical protein
MTFDRGDAIGLGVIAGAIGLLVFYVIPRIELAIAAVDLLIGGK